MAKGSGNSVNRRPSSRNAKPYDANNSFVKKVATKVTYLIPQSSWISKWFNTFQGNEITLDVRGNPEESELTDDMQRPPPNKRPRIRMDVIHPPGTFSIQPRDKTALNIVDPTKEQYTFHNEMSEDLLEPVTTGPSGIGHLISSTSTTQADIEFVTPHRSDLNPSPTNNGTANGMDDHSESSESTSGCSSLIPQINRHEGSLNLLYSSTFSNRKKHIDDKLTFTNHLQSPRSLFLDSNSRDTLSNRRPSFNASIMTNILDRASPLSSPFYSGNTIFGGANVAGLYKRGRNLFNNSSELQLKVPRRTNVEVKPSNASEVDSSGMSQTAKKILEALEHFSSPVSDAKKIPFRNANKTVSPLMSRKRAREEIATPSARVGLRHLTRELTVPTVPDILKLRRRQKLQDTTLAARKIVSAHSDPPPLAQEYQLRTENSDREIYYGKIKGKSKVNLEEEETIEPVNLPNIPLPISTLPSFNFTLPPASHILGKSTANKEDTFTFASPIKVTDAEKSSPSFNHFTFSNPINAENSTNNVMVDSNSLSKIENAASTTFSIDHATITSMPNFIWSGSSTAPRLKEKAKSSKDNFVGPTIAYELKLGSVMDILCPKSNQVESNLVAQSNLVSETAHIDKTTNAFTTYSNNKNTRNESFTSINSTANSPSGWECSECLIKNSSSDKQCTVCKVARQNSNDKVSILSSTIDIVKTKPIANDCFGSEFKLSTNQWECTACYVRNKQIDVKCVACFAPKPTNKFAMQQTVPTSVRSQKSDLAEKFRPAEGSWECPGCLLKNSASTITCPCCSASKPTSIIINSKKVDTAVESAKKLTFVNMEYTTTQVTEFDNSEIMNKFKPSKDSWECMGCLVRNNNSITICLCCGTAKSGGSIAGSNEQVSTNGFGNKFKKPEGAWNCDSCLLQNEAKYAECVACQALKPGTVKVNELVPNTSSTLQFKFDVSSSTDGFKFGIDKSENQSKSDSTSSLNGLKFGHTQQNSDTAQFTIDISKGESKIVASEISKNNSNTISSSNTGFQINIKNLEKFDTKLDRETKQDISFNMPKNDGSTTTSEKQCTNIAFSASQPVSTSTATPFVIDMQKPGFNQPVSNKEEQKTSFATTVTESSKSTAIANDATPISTSTTIPSLLTQNDTKATPIFSFGIPNSTSAVSNDTSATVMITTCLPTFAQSSFTFSDSKTASQTVTIPTFGQIPISSSTFSTNLPFGGNKIAETAILSSDKPAVSDTSVASIFPIVSTSASLFNNNESKTSLAFSADKPSTFVSTSNKSVGFAVPENKILIVPESKSMMFGTPEMKLPVFGSDEKTVPVFNSSDQASTVNPLPTFGAPSSVTPSSFGSSSSAFGNNITTPAFGAAITPTMFSSTKPSESNASANSPNPLFTFCSNQSVQQSTGNGFNFSTNANSAGSNLKQPLFTFGNSSNTPQNNSVFGSGTFANPAPTNPANFTFNAPKQETPTFGAQSAVASPMFGANPQTQVTSSFSSTPSSGTGFNFGSTATPAVAPSGGFNFGGMSSTPTGGGFSFNPPTTSTTSSVAFDPNSRPSFNFTKGSAPTAFNAPPQSPATAPQRKIKKAFRRCVR